MPRTLTLADCLATGNGRRHLHASAWFMNRSTEIRGQDKGNLVYYEQWVNDRHFTSPAPDIPSVMLPENGVSLPLAWRKVTRNSASVFSETEILREQMERELSSGDSLLVPIHPLDEKKFRSDEIVRSGRIMFSASYRTVFFMPEPGGPFADWVPKDKILMLKLHLEEPLPGIPGDRRLTKEIVERCIFLSALIPELTSSDAFAARLNVVPEFFGISSNDCGVIFRLLPDKGLIPVFSLYSRDQQCLDAEPVLVSKMRDLYGEDSAKAASSFGSELAAPLVDSLLAGFRAGISLEMHGQNTLVRLGETTLIDSVHFRDLEGALVFNDFRELRGLDRVELPSGQPLRFFTDASVQRLFNRNLDHDLGRIFTASLDTLCRYAYFDNHERRNAERSIRRVVRQSIEKANLREFNRLAGFMPFSRAPWGSGFRPGHYFSTRFR